jgi:hypothetical protein
LRISRRTLAFSADSWYLHLMQTGVRAKDSLLLLRALAGTWADRYGGEVLIPQLSRAVGLESPSLSVLRERLSDPYHSLEVLYSQYAFARRGGDRHELGGIAVEALRRLCDGSEAQRVFEPQAGEELWEIFCVVCAEKQRKPMDQLNRGVVSGILDLAREVGVVEGRGSINNWVVDGIVSSGRVESQFMRLVEIRGLGPKVASLYLRDMVFLHHLEDSLDFADRLYIHPIDKWQRAIAPFVVADLEDVDAPDWVLAGKLAKQTRKAGVSGIRFNMGTSFFGTREVRVPEALEHRLAAVRF